MSGLILSIYLKKRQFLLSLESKIAKDLWSSKVCSVLVHIGHSYNSTRIKVLKQLILKVKMKVNNTYIYTYVLQYSMGRPIMNLAGDRFLCSSFF